MTTLTIFLTSLLLQASMGRMEQDFLQRLVKFDEAYEGFKMELLGCPDKLKKQPIWSTSDCNPSLGTINAHLWIKTRKEAMKAFELQEKKEE